MNIPVFILAGGLGTRLSEETSVRPKPMVEIGGIPILLHVMRHYYQHGFSDFVVLAGYKSWEIKQFFMDYSYRVNHVEVDLRQSSESRGHTMLNGKSQEKWRVRVLDTGETAMTGARVARAMDLLKKDQIQEFALTYGDGLSDVDLTAEWKHHQKSAKLGTVLGVHPMARFGELEVSPEGLVTSFLEKPQGRSGRINGGFFFFKSGFRSYLSADDHCILEREPLVKLARDRELSVFTHDGFWHPMDTLRDKNHLDSLWASGSAPWLSKKSAHV